MHGCTGRARAARHHAAVPTAPRRAGELPRLNIAAIVILYVCAVSTWSAGRWPLLRRHVQRTCHTTAQHRPRNAGHAWNAHAEHTNCQLTRAPACCGLAAAARPATAMESLSLTKITNIFLVFVMTLVGAWGTEEGCPVGAAASSPPSGAGEPATRNRGAGAGPGAAATHGQPPWPPAVRPAQQVMHLFKYHIMDIKQHLYPRRLWKFLSEERGYAGGTRARACVRPLACVPRMHAALHGAGAQGMHVCAWPGLGAGEAGRGGAPAALLGDVRVGGPCSPRATCRLLAPALHWARGTDGRRPDGLRHVHQLLLPHVSGVVWQRQVSGPACMC